MQTRFKLSLILLLSALSLITHAAYNDKREQELAKLVTPTIKQGKIEWLNAPGRKFMAILAPATGRYNHGAIILLHDAGQHPDWPGVTRALRTGLPEHGWHTLSIQAPVLDEDAEPGKYAELLADTRARIEQSITWLQKKGHKTIVLIGHGMGANMALNTVKENSALKLQGLVMINLLATLKGEKLAPLPLIKTLRLATLDIAGSHLTTNVEKHMQLRKEEAARAGLMNNRLFPRYRSVMVSGADRHFSGLHDTLVKRIRGWLFRHVLSGPASNTSGDNQ